MAIERPRDVYTPFLDRGLPETESPGGGGPHLGVEATPEEFGAGLGKAVESVDQQTSRLSSQLGQMYTDTLARDATTNVAQQIGQATANFKQLQGVNAAAGYKDYQKQIQDIQQQGAKNLPPVAQAQFLNDSARYVNQAMDETGSHVAEQTKIAHVNSFTSSIQNDISAFAQNPMSPGADTFLQSLGQTAHQLAEVQGLPPDATKAYVTHNVGEAYYAGIRALAATNIDAANQLYQKAQNSNLSFTDVGPDGKPITLQAPALDANHRAQLADYMAPLIRNHDAALTANETMVAAEQFRATDNAQALQAPQTPDKIAQAIFGQESGKNPNVKASIDGAVGGYQILPATFKQFVQPGEKLDVNKPEDNALIGQRIISTYAKMYDNDPARVAVAYFSGPQNVAPKGSVTPWVHDTSDSNGKLTSSYVNDILKRINGTQGTADYYRANYTQVLQTAEDQAAQKYPGDTKYAEAVKDQVRQRMNETITQSDLKAKADYDTVYKAFSGQLSDGVRPTAVTQMTNISPEVSQAWDNLRSEDPQRADEIQNLILTKNSSMPSEELNKYGPNFYKLLQAVNAPVGTPGKIVDARQLLSYVTPGGGLTFGGLEALRKEIDGRSTPQGEAESGMRAQTFKIVHDTLVHDRDLGLGIQGKDTQGETLFGQASVLMYQALEKGKESGVPLSELYNPASENWIGHVADGLKRSEAQVDADATADTAEEYSGVSVPSGAKIQGSQSVIAHVASSLWGAATSNPISAIVNPQFPKQTEAPYTLTANDMSSLKNLQAAVAAHPEIRNQAIEIYKQKFAPDNAPQVPVE